MAFNVGVDVVALIHVIGIWKGQHSILELQCQWLIFNGCFALINRSLKCVNSMSFMVIFGLDVVGGGFLILYSMYITHVRLNWIVL